jgi:hypothetical protein
LGELSAARRRSGARYTPGTWGFGKGSRPAGGALFHVATERGNEAWPAESVTAGCRDRLTEQRQADWALD